MSKIKNLLILILAGVLLYSCGVKKNSLTKREYIAQNYLLLKDTLPEAQVTLLDDTIKVLFPNNLLFKVGSSKLSASIEPVMKKFAGALNRFPKTHILITGHTDNSGDEQENLALSLDRANSAKNSLLSNGVDSIRLFTWGLGDRNPLAPNDTEENRTLNRRVEFVVLYMKKD